ncbi:MAG TPA: hypothetical protein DDW50_05700 [Firmicutes bacterium]|nr:hypothetical protein [Bacillota bacterium]
MIVLDNYSQRETYIIIDSTGYSIVEKQKGKLAEQGEGGFSEDGQLLGIYVEADKLFFIHNDKKYKTNPDNIICSNTNTDSGKRHFQVEISNQVVCDITYKPYISPLLLAFDEDEAEFDFLLYLSNLLRDKDSILKFIKAIPEINKL